MRGLRRRERDKVVWYTHAHMCTVPTHARNATQRNATQRTNEPTNEPTNERTNEAPVRMCTRMHKSTSMHVCAPGCEHAHARTHAHARACLLAGHCASGQYCSKPQCFSLLKAHKRSCTARSAASSSTSLRPSGHTTEDAGAGSSLAVHSEWHQEADAAESQPSSRGYYGIYFIVTRIL